MANSRCRCLALRRPATPVALYSVTLPPRAPKHSLHSADPPLPQLRSAALALSSLALAYGHGAVTYPPPRQAVDHLTAPWSGTVPENIPFMFWCAKPAHPTYDRHHPTPPDARNLTGSNGQACFWCTCC